MADDIYLTVREGILFLIILLGGTLLLPIIFPKGGDPAIWGLGVLLILDLLFVGLIAAFRQESTKPK